MTINLLVLFCFYSNSKFGHPWKKKHPLFHIVFFLTSLWPVLLNTGYHIENDITTTFSRSIQYSIFLCSLNSNGNRTSSSLMTPKHPLRVALATTYISVNKIWHRSKNIIYRRRESYLFCSINSTIFFFAMNTAQQYMVCVRVAEGNKHTTLPQMTRFYLMVDFTHYGHGALASDHNQSNIVILSN